MNSVSHNPGHILEIILYVFSLTSDDLAAVDLKSFSLCCMLFCLVVVCVSIFYLFGTYVYMVIYILLEFMLFMLCLVE
jgi:hypothetical protein